MSGLPNLARSLLAVAVSLALVGVVAAADYKGTLR
jgi:hypothetical protein